MTASERPILQGGPLQGRYLLDSAHFHWLPNDDATGGTHVINNVRCDQSYRLAGGGREGEERGLAQGGSEPPRVACVRSDCSEFASFRGSIEHSTSIFFPFIY